MESNRSIYWPRPDFSRTPSAVFRDRDVYLREQERIFCGPVWCYLALEAEIPHPGDFKTCFVGDRPVVVSRAADGSLHAFVNRCSHRGTTVIREERGNRMSHTCVYHQWTYDATGALIGVPFEHGVTGKIGMPEDFDRSEHGLRRLATESYRGLVFGTFDPDGVEPLHDYLDEPMRETIDRLFGKPIEVLGYMRQRIPANWKLYWENLNDGYHSGLLHQMFTAFGLARNTQPGGAYMDKLNRHNVWRIYEDDADVEDVVAEYSSGEGAYDESLKLLDGSIVDFHDEVGDGQIQAVMSIFPNLCVQQIANTLATRQLRLKAPDDFEVYWTYFGYRDDDPTLRMMRLKQVNIEGPGGLIAMEDAETMALGQRAISREHEDDGLSYIGMGGHGPIGDQDQVNTEVPIRGFWRYYCHIMDYPAQDQTPWPQ